MRFISITKSINIRLDWANITGTALKAGTPISLTGVVANTADAVGILSQDVSKSDAVVAVVTEGTIDLGEIAASYGELDDAAISAMHGITFIDDGEPVAPSGGGGGLPDYSEASDGDVLAIEDGAPAWKEPSGGGGALILTRGNGNVVTGATAAEIRAAAAAGTPLYIKYGNEMRPAAFIYDEFNDCDAVRADWVELKIDYETEAQTAIAKFWTVFVNETTLGTLRATFVDLASAD